MKVVNGLVMILEEDKKFLCVWQLNYVSNFTDSRMKVPTEISIKSYFMRSFFFLSVFSSSQLLAKITSIRSELLSAAWWSREEKRGNCEANLVYVEKATSVPQTPQTNRSQCSSPVETLNLIVE